MSMPDISKVLNKEWLNDFFLNSQKIFFKKKTAVIYIRNGLTSQIMRDGRNVLKREAKKIEGSFCS